MKGVNILVVDDEEVVLQSCARALGAHRYKVTTAHSVDEALEQLGKRYFHVIIVDLIMPKKGGMELLKYIKQHFTRAQVIMITGYSSINTAVEAIKLGAYDYLSKPFSPNELVITVKNALEGKGRSLYPFLSDHELPAQMIFDNIIGQSPRMIEVFKLISKIAATDSTVLITGESGTGKELVARAIHKNSHRSDAKFVTVDCLALTPTLLESELFGHTKGSFTGAVSTKVGFFEVANGGTLFLDEIGDLSFELQGKLLRVIQERKYIPVGGTEPKQTDIRLIAATNKNLKQMVLTGAFREDLFYRLYVVPIFLPPLRERKEDISILAEHFFHKFCVKYNRPLLKLPAAIVEALTYYNWPGNIRELENSIERAVLSCEGDELTPADLPGSVREAGP
ncbi:MAG TPA: sigma-54 dependent transcriptional regulator, partial [bacterium]|nr:sigma-54 dependent transcriptional regulator [bacterium]